MGSGVIVPITLKSGNKQSEWSAPASLPSAKYLLDVISYLIKQPRINLIPIFLRNVDTDFQVYIASHSKTLISVKMATALG